MAATSDVSRRRSSGRADDRRPQPRALVPEPLHLRRRRRSRCCCSFGARLIGSSRASGTMTAVVVGLGALDACRSRRCSSRMHCRPRSSSRASPCWSGASRRPEDGSRAGAARGRPSSSSTRSGSRQRPSVSMSISDRARRAALRSFVAGGIARDPAAVRVQRLGFPQSAAHAVCRLLARASGLRYDLAPSWSGLSLELFSSLGLLTLAPMLAARSCRRSCSYRRGKSRRGVRLPRRSLARLSSTSPETALSAGWAAALPDADHALRAASAGARAFDAGRSRRSPARCDHVLPGGPHDRDWPARGVRRQWLERVADRQFVGDCGCPRRRLRLVRDRAVLPCRRRRRGLRCGDAASAPHHDARRCARRGRRGRLGRVALGSYNQWGRTPTSSYVLTVFVVALDRGRRGCAHGTARKAP